MSKWLGHVRYSDNADPTDRVYTYLTHVDDLAKLQAFCQSVAPLIGATADKLGVTELDYVSIPGSASPYVDVHQHLQVSLWDADNEIRRGFMLPAPAKDLFELQSGVYRLKKTYGDQLAAYYQILTGFLVTFKSGALVGPQI